MVNEHFFPQVLPTTSGRLAATDVHDLYYETCGPEDGEPILFLHGGPGAGCTETDRRFFDPSHFRVVLFDQRGCGRSKPVGEISSNTIDDLVTDIESLRCKLGIDRWHVFGGSWGSTLSLYYAQEHPEHCKSLVLRGIWLVRPEELDWWLNGMRWFQPELWDQFVAPIPVEERGDLLEAYWRILNGDDREKALEAAKTWSIYEGSCCTLLPNSEFTSAFAEPDLAWALARLEAHYFRNVRFTPILDRVDRIRDIPSVIVHGRYDLVCPVRNALDLAKAWPEARLEIVADAGHSSHEPGITRELVAATERIRRTGSPL